MLFLLTLIWFMSVYSVDRSKFRTCSDTSFCRKFRQKDRLPLGDTYRLTPSSLQDLGDGRYIGKIVGPKKSPDLNLKLTASLNGIVRVKITEEIERWEPKDLLMESSLISGEILKLNENDPRIPSSLSQLSKSSRTFMAISPTTNDGNKNLVLALQHDPFKVELYCDGVLQIVANNDEAMHFEWKQTRGGSVSSDSHTKNDDNHDRHGGKKIVGYWEDGLAIYEDGTREEKIAVEDNDVEVDTDGEISNNEDESWVEKFGPHVDSRPDGPMSVGMDFSFPFADHIYGIPEHASPLSLPTSKVGSGSQSSKYNEPYRLYNLDVFEYELDNTMALYGSIPFMLAHGLTANSQPMTTGLFWFNPSESFVDIYDGGSPHEPLKQSRWISETGNLDFFIIPGPTISDVYSQWASIIGTQELPPMFALGYHQCRWNYRDEKDVATVEQAFEDLDYPMDVIWLDIEHTDGKRYFTWNDNLFPNPIEMQKNISAHGRKMVTIVDPHIKRDNGYHIHDEATRLGLYIKNKDGADYDGWCWPGQSSYLDFTSPHVRQWWGEKFSTDVYQGSTLDLYTWNDMNEPSVFNGPEVSMQKDTKNLEGLEHRYWHNLYGTYMQQATAEGQVMRTKNTQPAPDRAFVLSRAFWAGSQRFGAIWTGDNTAEWGHLKIASPMLLSINLAGLSFAGADVGGFFGEPSPELFTRWYQAGSFTPFFRGHAHHDTKRREPWVHGEPHTKIRRETALLRYTLLPLWYTVFYETYVSGMPVMRPMFMEFPHDSNGFAIDDQWMIGDALLVKPITDEGSVTTSIYIPSSSGLWYDLIDGNVVYNNNNNKGENLQVSAPLEKIPVLVRGGKIVPRKMRLRRSATLMYHDPYTFLIAPNNEGFAEGRVYMDDETTESFKSIYSSDGRDNFAYRNIEFKNGIVSCTQVDPSRLSIHTPKNTVERIEILDQNTSPSKVVLEIGGGSHSLEFHHSDGKLIIKKPNVLVAADWNIKII